MFIVDGKLSSKICNDHRSTIIEARGLGSSHQYLNNPYFIVSTGRSGTKSIAEYLGKGLNTECFHEPKPKLIIESSCYRYGICSEDEIVRILKNSRISTKEGLLYGESNQNLSLIIPVINKAFPNCKFVWLIRNGLDVVASASARGWYSGCHLGKKYRQLTVAEKEWVNGRIKGHFCSAIEKSVWETMNSFERCCWYWSFMNELIESDLHRFVFASRYIMIRLEDMNAKKGELADWIGVKIDSNIDFERNNTANYAVNHYTSWTSGQWDAFDRWCGPLMDKYYPGWKEKIKTNKCRAKAGQFVKDESLLRRRLLAVGWQKKVEKYSKHVSTIEIKNKIAKPKISIVVISWRYVTETLNSFKILEKQRDQKFELIFVNNGCPKKEFNIIEPYVDIQVTLNNNTGAYLARNIGAIFASSPIILFLEDDGIADPKIIERHIEAHNEYEILSLRGVCKAKSSGNPFNSMAQHYYLGDNPYPHPVDLEGNASYKASAFFNVGGWDDDIRFGHGGIVLSWRLLEFDPDFRKQMYSPYPIIYHDYAKDKEHLDKKRRAQRISMSIITSKYKSLKKLMMVWLSFRGRHDLLIRKDPGTNTLTYNSKNK